MHPLAQHLILHRQLPLNHLVRRVATKATSNAVALSAPGRVSNGLPNGSNIDSHSLGVQDSAIRGFIHELKRHVASVVVPDAVTEVDVDCVADGGALEDEVVEVVAKFGFAELFAFFDGVVQLGDGVLCQGLDVSPGVIVRALDTSDSLGDALAWSATKGDILDTSALAHKFGEDGAGRCAITVRDDYNVFSCEWLLLVVCEWAIAMDIDATAVQRYQDIGQVPACTD